MSIRTLARKIALRMPLGVGQYVREHSQLKRDLRARSRDLEAYARAYRALLAEIDGRPAEETPPAALKAPSTRQAAAHRAMAARVRSRAAQLDQLQAEDPMRAAEIKIARRLYRAGRYEAALETLDRLPPDVRSSRKVWQLARDCHLGMGELSKALAELAQATDTGPNEGAERQGRQLRGRLRETDVSWLPDAGPPVAGPVASEGPRILHLGTESLPFVDPAAGHSALLAQRVAGLDPVVVTSLGFPRHQGVDPFPPVETIDGIVHHRLDLGPEYALDEVPVDLQLSDGATLTRQLAERIGPALIQAGSGHRGYETALVGLAVARCLGIPFAYDVRSLEERCWTSDTARSGRGEYYERRRAQDIRCMREADLVLTTSEQLCREVVARGVTAEKVHVVPSAVDVDRFTPRPADPQLRRAYGLEHRPVLGYVAGRGHHEDVEHLIRALAVLRRSGTDAACLVTGAGQDRESLRGLVTELGLDGHVVLTGHVDSGRIADHYALIDLFVVPHTGARASRLATPLGPLEAMAMERAVIAADLPVLRELLAAGERGEVFPPADADALAKVAGALLQDDVRRGRLARAGRTWVAAERTITANARRYDRILRPILTGAG